MVRPFVGLNNCQPFNGEHSKEKKNNQTNKYPLKKKSYRRSLTNDVSESRAQQRKPKRSQTVNQTQKPRTIPQPIGCLVRLHLIVSPAAGQANRTGTDLTLASKTKKETKTEKSKSNMPRAGALKCVISRTPLWLRIAVAA